MVSFIEKIRSKDPGIGGKKLWYLYQKEYQATHPVGRDTFEGIVAANGLYIRKPRKHPRTTDSRHNYPKYPNLVKSVIPDHPNQIWACDITYMPYYPNSNSKEYNFAYISLVTDVYTKLILGWSVGATLDTQYPLEALDMAVGQFGEEAVAGVVHHSDRGVQYASFDYVDRLKKYKMLISMTESGDPKDNAFAERTNETLKDELFKGRTFSSVLAIKKAMPDAIAFYNNVRPHMSLNNMTPAEASQQKGEINKLWISYREKAIKSLSSPKKLLPLPTEAQKSAFP